MSKVLGPGICDCSCHTDKDIRHVVACCKKCSICKKNVAIGSTHKCLNVDLKQTLRQIQETARQENKEKAEKEKQEAARKKQDDRARHRALAEQQYGSYIEKLKEAARVNPDSTELTVSVGRDDAGHDMSVRLVELFREAGIKAAVEQGIVRGYNGDDNPSFSIKFELDD